MGDWQSRRARRRRGPCWLGAPVYFACAATGCGGPVDPANGVHIGRQTVVQELVPAEDGSGTTCLTHSLAPNTEGLVSTCAVIEARASDTCSCETPGHTVVPETLEPVIDAIQDLAPDAAFTCFCLTTQVRNTALVDSPADCEANFDQPGHGLCACQYTPLDLPVTAGGDPVDGWCYVDPSREAGSPALVTGCPENEQQLVRFVGAGKPPPGASAFIVCSELVQW